MLERGRMVSHRGMEEKKEREREAGLWTERR